MSDSMTKCVVPLSSAKSCSLSMCTPRTYCATRSNHGLNSEQVFSWLLLSSKSYLRHINIAYKSTYTPYTHCNFLKLQINKYKYYQLISIFFTSAAAQGHHNTRPNLQRDCRQICKKGHVLKAADINRHLLDLGIISKCFLVYHCKTPLLLLICKYESC